MENEVLTEYRHYLKSLGYKEDAVIKRIKSVRKFLDFAQKHYAEITSEDLEKYYQYLQEKPNRFKAEKGIKQSTILQYIRNVEQFYEMLAEYGKLGEPITINPEAREDDIFVREILSQEEIQKLYEVAGELQEKIILHLAYGCGLRAGELVKANKEDVYLKENLLIVPRGKFNKRRIIPLTETIKNDLELFISIERKDFEEKTPLLLHSKGGRIQEWTLNRILKKMLKKIKISDEIDEGDSPTSWRQRIKKISIHSLRHSIATHLLENGMAMEKVKEFLGHKNLETTEIYTRISKKLLKDLRI
ncbi:tyrosine-type recombinase/integrase [Chryseobacterium suipulveris]|uniref:Tyrosine-type recombinase/integrase n=1 Tax=Chryseobacterium suipulveris TaxID=2929800 RepID=A0ABY4BM81_9FLAO|nr:tyrosine-type recombinase/integrase [Chryseobacterium suipulveris]UOE39869.1 tyrosine-type recombinase/integrase [Chryseobacterium suipulveris]UOE39876.1 tyrosine-type recombinase/integrase [Chryseobacterium suipulveris]